MASVTEEINLYILLNFNLNSHIWLVITVLDNAALYTFVLFGKSLIFNNNNAYLYYGLGHAVMTNCPKKRKEE